jgi:hypothetical protein
MKRAELEHIIRAAANIADDDEIIVIGSQSILAQFPDAPAELLISNEADVYPKNRPERSDLIDGSIGELSPFHRTFGYYAQGVEQGTAPLPAGWEARLVPIRNTATRGATGWCLEVHDLVLSKYVAAREKDLLFNRTAAAHGLVDRAVLLQRLASVPVSEAERQRIRQSIESDCRTA